MNFAATPTTPILRQERAAEPPGRRLRVWRLSGGCRLRARVLLPELASKLDIGAVGGLVLDNALQPRGDAAAHPDRS